MQWTGNWCSISSRCVELLLCPVPSSVSTRRQGRAAAPGSCTCLCLCPQPPCHPHHVPAIEEGSSNPPSTSSQNIHLKTVMPCIDSGAPAFQGVPQDMNPLSHPRWSQQSRRGTGIRFPQQVPDKQDFHFSHRILGGQQGIGSTQQ